MDIFEQVESNVRYYSTVFPDVFEKAKGSLIYSEEGREFLDFFAGAGSLNYGHNHDFIKQVVIEYVMGDGITQGLDKCTSAKKHFLIDFQKMVLQPRNLNYKVQFCSPSGTNAVEAALKLARKVTGRTQVFSFMGSFHGMTMGSLSVTSNQYHRGAAGVPLHGVTFLPYDNGGFMNVDSLKYLRMLLEDTHSGSDIPAAIIFESIQAEGGVNVASNEWLWGLREICTEYGILLICDDIQVGCGRIGPFFSFERAGIVPDIVLLSKSISGYGYPMAIALFKPEYDVWQPGEHNGTFRGNQLAFLCASAALHLREAIKLEEKVKADGAFVEEYLLREFLSLAPELSIRGYGMIWGIDCSKVLEPGEIRKVISDCYVEGLIIESAGRHGTVIKVMPALTIERERLEQGLTILLNCFKKVLTMKSGFYALLKNN